MKIAIDTSPLNDQNLISHRVRGVGFYVKHLKDALLKYYPDNEYIFFTRGERLDSSTDLIHYPYFDPFFLTLPFFEKTKRVVTVHDLTPQVFPEHFPAGLKGNFKWQIQKINLLKSERVLTDSKASKKDIEKHAGYDKNKIDVIYLAASKEFGQLANGSWLAAIRQKYKLPAKFVLYVGDITWNKNIPRLIKASIKINIPLILVGAALANKNYDKNNPWNQDLVECIGLIEKSKRVRVLGFVPTEDLVAIYNLANVFVMPSLYEGFGLPILEAMQSGCPVVTSKEGSLPEVAGENAYYVDAQSIDSIAVGINEVFESTKLQNEFSKKGLDQAKKFSWQKTAEKTIEAYEKILNT
ncbi:MAG: glycosyltransferase family 4 protein [Ginsengibacter sp.]